MKPTLKNKISLKTDFLVLLIFLFSFHSLLFAQFPVFGDGVTDSEGNVYQTVILENGQEWMAENLKVNLFSNGDSIPALVTNSLWQVANSGAYSIYENNTTNSTIYGNLYNWYVTIDERNICPIGWHVPTDFEWTDYSDLLGGNGVAGGKIKMQDTLYWIAPNLGATNESLFSGLPAGCRYDGGNYSNKKKYAYWWTSTQLDNQFSWYRTTNYNSDNLVKNYVRKQSGYSVRCLKNQPLGLYDENNAQISIFPNPTNDMLTIKAGGFSKTLFIQNLNGLTIKTIQMTSKEEQISLNFLSNGIYFIVDSSTMKRIRFTKF